MFCTRFVVDAKTYSISHRVWFQQMMMLSSSFSSFFFFHSCCSSTNLNSFAVESFGLIQSDIFVLRARWQSPHGTLSFSLSHSLPTICFDDVGLVSFLTGRLVALHSGYQDFVSFFFCFAHFFFKHECLMQRTSAECKPLGICDIYTYLSSMRRIQFFPQIICFFFLSFFCSLLAPSSLFFFSSSSEWLDLSTDKLP